MAEKPEEGRTAQAAAIGGMGGTLFGAMVTALLMAKPAEAAPPEDKLNYLIDCLTTLAPVLAEVAESNAQLVALLQQWLAAQGVPGVPGVEVSVRTPWVAKEPEEIFRQAILSKGTFYTDKMVNWTEGKRILFKVESSLNVAIQVQVIGNIVDNKDLATDIGPPITCDANDNTSVGLAWDDWHPYIGVRITVAEDPSSGILTISAVTQG